LRHGYSGVDFCDALVGAIFVDELDLADADLLVDARPLLGGGLRRSDWTTNGCSLLCCCEHHSVTNRVVANTLAAKRLGIQRAPRWMYVHDAIRRMLKIGSFCP
jgi:2-hydroxychromene-2-carboxylate isomerase